MVAGRGKVHRPGAGGARHTRTDDPICASGRCPPLAVVYPKEPADGSWPAASVGGPPRQLTFARLGLHIGSQIPATSDGKTHRAYIWSYCTTSFNATKAVVFQFTEGRSGENVQQFLKLDTPQAWRGTLVTDGFSGYTATTTKGVTSAQCMAHSRRKFNDLWANHRSEVGRHALRYYQCLFRIERELEELPGDERRRIRQRKSRRVLSVFHRWLLAQRQLVPTGSATIKAIDYSLKRWTQITRFVQDGDVPTSSNWVAPTPA